MALPLWKQTARQLSEQLRSNALSSLDIVEAFIERRLEVDGEVNAMVQTLDDESRKAATALDNERKSGKLRSALHGLPVTVKENIDIRGYPSTLGIQSRLDQPAREDAVVVKSLRDAGAIPIAKTNVPQTLLSPMDTTNHIWGRTCNPWNLKRATGASSGGEGAALASGQSVLGIGTDIGGSIRFPAAFCGVTGIKPTLHRWSNRGARGGSPGQESVRAQVGPMARNVDDLVLLYETLQPSSMSRWDGHVPPMSANSVASVDTAKLKVGYFVDDGFFSPAPYAVRAVEEAVRHLKESGAEVIPIHPQNSAELIYTMIRIVSSDGGNTVLSQLKGEDIIEPLKLMKTGARLPEAARKAASLVLRARGEHRTAQLLESLGKKPVEELWKLTAKRSEMRHAELEQWNRHELDALVCPVHIVGPAPHGIAHDFTLAFSYAGRYNVLDFPAGSVPVTRVQPKETTGSRRGTDKFDKRAIEVEKQAAGLPVGVQVVGRPWQEHIALAVMQRIESAARQGKHFPHTPIDPH